MRSARPAHVLRAPETRVPALALVLGLVVPAMLLAGCDCSGRIDGGGTPCVTSAECPTGSACVDGVCDGTGTTDGGAIGSCTSDPPVPVAEACNGRDDDCDGQIDDGVLSSCGDCDPSCEGEHLGPGTGTPFDPEGHTDGSESEGVGLDDDGAIVLDSRRIETAFIWIANTGDGTVSKVDTRTRVEVARYRTGPAGGADDPSRTSVNSLGDVYVANRAGRSVTKISVLGADCTDTDGDGVVRTSTGPTDVLPWGQDDCVLWNVSLPDGGILRALAAQDTLGPDGEIITAVWVGGWEGLAWKLDGENGAIVVRTASPTNNYGFALDGAGNLWIAGRSARVLGRIDTRRCLDTASCDVAPCGDDGDSCIKQQVSIPEGHNPYGITVDADQRVWVAMHGTSTIGRYDHDAAGARWTFVNVGVDCHGIAADGAGWVWAAGYGAGVVRLDADDPTMFSIVPGTDGRGSKGMAIDFDGQVWSINQGTDDATVIEPGATLGDATVTTSVVPAGIERYTYSDMTGQQLRLATDPRGWYRRPFEGCPEGADVETEWRELRFEGSIPPGTLMRFRVRTAATREALASAMWILVGEAPPATSPLSIDDALVAASVEPQRWIEVEVQLEAMRSSATEIISPRLTSLTVTRQCGSLVF
ncbi:hypothetical protein [Sandaracinus amylolyticus]|nr:hypothetical protein [Sandaracinus amylolyticus]